MGNDDVFGVGDVTMTLARVKVGVVISITQEKNRYEANRRGRNIEGILEYKSTRGHFKLDDPHADGVHRVIAKASDWVRLNGMQ